jgi:glycosyltransferase involved in cell wall biosynthesis
MIMSKIMQNVDRIICVSEFELQHFQRVLRLPKEKFAFVPNGVDCEEFRGTPCRKTGSYSLLSVGRLEKYKGHHRVLRGFKSFKVLHPDIKIDLCIVGNGPYKSSLQRESELLGLHDYVHFVSWLPQREYRSLLKESLALVLLSDYESQSIVVSESLCARTPVIVSDNSALADYVRQNLALGVANPDDPREVASKIESLLSGTYGQRTHNYNPASWEDVVARLIRIYQEVLTSDGNKHPR